jgi:two-component system response regulator FixJ
MHHDNLIYHRAFNRDRVVQIVNHNPLICEQLSLLFRLDGFQTTFSMEVEHFINDLSRRAPDVAVIDMQVGEECGLELLRRLKSETTGSLAIMTTSSPKIEDAVAAMKLGAADVVATPIDNEHLLSVVRDVLRRDVHVGAMDGGRRSVQVRGFAQLTPREREVLQLITNGNTNKQVGNSLGISGRTVEVHRANLMRKLGARNSSDLVRIVLTS